MIRKMKVQETNKTIGSWKGRETIWQPKVQLSGIWLHEAGFRAGDSIEVEVNNNSIIIRKVEAEGRGNGNRKQAGADVDKYRALYEQQKANN